MEAESWMKYVFNDGSWFVDTEGGLQRWKLIRISNCVFNDGNWFIYKKVVFEDGS